MSDYEFIKLFEKIRRFTPTKSQSPDDAVFSSSKLEHVIMCSKKEIENDRNGESK